MRRHETAASLGIQDAQRPDSYITYLSIYRHMGRLELDMHEVYGFDMGAPGALRSRSWRWLRLRMFALCSTPGSRLQRVLLPDLTPRSVLPPPRDAQGRERLF